MVAYFCHCCQGLYAGTDISIWDLQLRHFKRDHVEDDLPLSGFDALEAPERIPA